MEEKQAQDKPPM